MKMVYLISYDIADEKRLQRIYRFMKGIGIHLQKSVFYAVLENSKLKRILNELNQLINEKEDDVRIYPLLVEFDSIIMGRGDKVPGGVWIYLD